MGVIVVAGQEYDIDPVQLRAIADRADDLAEELAGLDPAVLTPLTLNRSPGFIAERLRSVAKLVERKQSGEPGLADIFDTLPADDSRKAFAEMSRGERRRAVAEMGLGQP
jgi:hypothetical protein